MVAQKSRTHKTTLNKLNCCESQRLKIHHTQRRNFFGTELRVYNWLKVLINIYEMQISWVTRLSRRDVVCLVIGTFPSNFADRICLCLVCLSVSPSLFFITITYKHANKHTNTYTDTNECTVRKKSNNKEKKRRIKHSCSFLPRCMECRRGLAMRFLSVRASVCQTRALWQNGGKICPDLYTIWKNI